jgi:multiple sugar transport system substrate-binding protein
MTFDIKRVIAIFLVSFLATSLLSGCYKDVNMKQDTSVNPENVVESGEVSKKPVMEKIRVWSDNAHEKDLRLQQIERFNSTTGKQLGIEIEYTVYGSHYQEAIKAALLSGTAPELFRPTSALLKNFVDSGYMVPITELPGGNELVVEYEESLVNNQHVFAGKVYTLPYNLTTYKLIVNDDLLQKAGVTEAPTTWVEVREAARRITEEGEGKAFGWILGLQSDWMISTYLIRPNGTNVGHVGFDFHTMKFDFSSFAPVFEAVQGMIDDGSVFPGYEGLDADAVRAQFAEGRIGMIPGASFDISVYNDQFPASCNWSVVPVPAFTEEASSYKEFADATSLLGVGIAAKEKAAKTLEVLKFFYSDENAAQMYEDSLYIPFRQEAIDLAVKNPEQKGFAAFANIPDRVLMRPSPENSVSLQGDEYRKTIANYFAGLYEDQGLIEVLKDLDKRYNSALEMLTPEVLKEYMQSEEVLISYKK